MHSTRHPVLPLLRAPLTNYQQTVWATQMYPLCQQIRQADIKLQKLEKYLWKNRTSVPKELLQCSYPRKRVQLEHTPLCTASMFCSITSGQLKFFQQCTAPTPTPLAFKPLGKPSSLVLQVYRFCNKTYTLRHILEHILNHCAPYVLHYFLGVSALSDVNDPGFARRKDYLKTVTHMNNRTRKCKCLFELISSLTSLSSIEQVLVPVKPHQIFPVIVEFELLLILVETKDYIYLIDYNGIG